MSPRQKLLCISFKIVMIHKIAFFIKLSVFCQGGLKFMKGNLKKDIRIISQNKRIIFKRQ